MAPMSKPKAINEWDKSGNISDLGSRIMKGYFKPNASPRPSPRPWEGSVEVEKDADNTQRSIKIQKQRRRSRTGDEVKGLALKVRQFGNFVEEDSNVN